MLLHLLYIIAFTILAFLAVGNLIRNLMTLGFESQRGYSASKNSATGNSLFAGNSSTDTAPHPELLDATGNVINEPLLVMRSMSVEDAREQLDAIYKASPGKPSETREDS